MPRTLTTIPCLIAVCVTGLWAQGGGRGRGNAPVAAPVDPHELSGYWELPADTHDGRNIPSASLMPAVSKNKLDEIATHDAKGYRWCYNVGMPNLMLLQRPLDIRITPEYMIIMPEYSAAQNRWIYLNRDKHVPEEEYEAGVNGDSIGHWDGATLVVETTMFSPDHGILSIPGGGFRTPASKLTERFKLLKNGQVLQVISTWTDSRVFAVPQTYELHYYRLQRDYEARTNVVCDPYDDVRTQLLTRPPKATP